MFSVKHNECVGFESKWKVVKVSTESSTQTSEFAVESKGSNTALQNSIEVQTDEPVVEQKEEVDMEKLANWLKSIYPKVNKEINDSNNSKAFRGYRLMDEARDFSCQLLQVVNGGHKTGKGDLSETISSMCWNSTGKILAVAHTHQHRHWCHHIGSVTIYSYKDKKLLDGQAKKLNTESCVTSIKFHASSPSVLAAGTFTGVIYFWNLNQEQDEQLLCTVNAHEQNVTQLLWKPDIDSPKDFLLASSSIDGQLKLWSFDLSTSEVLLKIRYKIRIPLFGKIKRETPVSDEVARKTFRGIVAFDFSKHILDMFLVALEGGVIVQCSMSGATELKGSSESVPLLDPVFKYYDAHEGEILSIAFSPNRKEMFMTHGTDSDIRIYLLDQDDPAQLIYTKGIMNQIMWIPYEDKLIAGCGHNGTVEIFDVQKGKLIDNIKSDKVSKSILMKMVLNNDNSNIVTLASVNGDIQLWNVPWNMISFKNQL